MTKKTKGFSGYGNAVAGCCAAIGKDGVGYYAVSSSNKIYQCKGGNISKILELQGYASKLKKGATTIWDIVHMEDELTVLGITLGKSGNKPSFSLQRVNDINLGLTDEIKLFDFKEYAFVTKTYSPDRNKIVFCATDKKSAVTKVAVVSVSDYKLLFKQSIPLPGLSEGKIRTNLQCCVDNQGNVYLLRSDLKIKSSGNQLALSYCLLSFSGDKSPFYPFELKVPTVTGYKVMATPSGTYLGVAHNKGGGNWATGLSVHKLNKEKQEEILNHEFTPQELYALKNPYSVRHSSKTAKNKLLSIRFMDLKEINNELLLVIEQYKVWTGENGKSVAHPYDLSILTIRDKKLTHIVNFPKAEFSSGGSKDGAQVQVRNNKLLVLTGAKNLSPLILLTYDPSNKRLTKRSFDQDLSGNKLKGYVGYDMYAYYDGKFFGPINFLFKGVGLLKVQF